MKPIAGEPGSFSDIDRTAFIALVKAGGEVSDVVLARNVKNAKALVLLRGKEGIKGVAALKKPLASYRRRISGKSEFHVDASSFPYELGYIYIVPEARGQHLSGPLVNAAIDAAAGAGIFATARVDNARMHASLVKAGFEAQGKPYGGRGGKRQIQIFIRPG
ncbi:GCN5-related N-acetyltransferase [Methylocella silvestris BL2]|uniref:GCN5-related N-acetyltransferase n=1 Tax=Methylocella silvestris (strain DSM 15510 / CIP 108128 / LMG 27833 / NCIMB 13906 / BL2) TaxID=395965 RepID=B8EPP7_METSB|nr:N-acetyltransferase GCN5 [Methylocella silvestris]ACK50901.1 GCN5-related N-acetyltransferase [Methylocella silvestris BL2]